MANTYTLIASNTVGSGGAATITFTSIPQTYTDLKILLSIRSDTTDLDTYLSFNGSTASFTGKRLYGSGSAVASDSVTRSYGLINMSSFTASTFANNEVTIPNYTSSNFKSYSVDSVTENNATQAYAIFVAGLWSNTAAITSITLGLSSANFVQYSTAYLYGIKNS
jgi:hypothetical protein